MHPLIDLSLVCSRLVRRRQEPEYERGRDVQASRPRRSQRSRCASYGDRSPGSVCRAFLFFHGFQREALSPMAASQGGGALAPR